MDRISLRSENATLVYSDGSESPHSHFVVAFEAPEEKRASLLVGHGMNYNDAIIDLYQQYESYQR